MQWALVIWLCNGPNCPPVTFPERYTTQEECEQTGERARSTQIVVDNSARMRAKAPISLMHPTSTFGCFQVR